MEFGLGEALPIYAGGLGILAGDVLKTASDLGLPIVGIGLLYQSGYFRQLVDAKGWQQEILTYNEPASLPIEPVSKDGDLLVVKIELPGRLLRLRVWRARVGCVDLYLLDSNDPLNHPLDRGITGQLYGGGSEQRLMQEVVLGVGGWQLLESLGLDVEICHINEGHAAFAVLERARQFMRKAGVSFAEAFWATRAGNVFTTHTPVNAGFDRYAPELIRQYLPYAERFLTDTGLSLEQALALGRADPNDAREPFNMAFLAMRGSLLTFGVSKLHGAVSRHIFSPLFPRWPEHEVPVSHVTNGIHVPTWDSPWADEIWTSTCGRERWRGPCNGLEDAIAGLSDERLWSLRASERADLLRYVRGRLVRQLGARAAGREAIAEAESALDSNVLTLGFARRFTGYKRPNLLLRQPDRLTALLTDPHRPVQLVIAGKAHPQDTEGKAMIQAWVEFGSRPAVRQRVALLEDYDITLAQELVEGVDVWINTPRPPMEACGTSGMKVLVNGGLNLSVLDGWWAEAYAPGLGWAVGTGPESTGADRDEADAQSLYALLEQEVIPEFYERDASGVPRRWIQRIRRSMAELTTAFSSNRMMLDYVEHAYRPAALRLRERMGQEAAIARALVNWANRVQAHWQHVRVDEPRPARDGDVWSLVVPVYLRELVPADVRVELYADPLHHGGVASIFPLERGEAIPGTLNGFLYTGNVPVTRPSSHYTARVVPKHQHAQLPQELPLIHWQR
jgi:starch phosphorylase